MTPDEVIRLRHMIDAAQKAQQFIGGRQRADLDSDTMLLFALVQAIQIVGETAMHISQETRATTPEVPWPQTIGMRNRLAHAYADINHEVVWQTVTVEVPAVLPLLTALLPQD